MAPAITSARLEKDGSIVVPYPQVAWFPRFFSRPIVLVFVFIFKIIYHLSRSLQLFFWCACEESFALWGSICFEQLLVDPLKQFVRSRFCAQVGPIRQENQFTVDQFPVVVLAWCNHAALTVCHLWSLP